MKRPPGTGSISPHPGGFLARLWINGKRESLGVHPTEEIAAGVLDGMLHKRGLLRPGSAGGKETLGEFARRVLQQREAEGIRGVAKEKASFRLYIEKSHLAQTALVNVTTLDLKDFARTMKLRRRKSTRAFIKHRTILRTMTVLGAVFSEAMEQQLLPANPFLGVRVKEKKAEKDASIGVFWDVLSADEQMCVVSCEDIPEWGRLLMQFAWGTGLRQGEQWDLELRDLHLKGCQGCERGVAANPDPHLYVRNSKNGRPRVVPLFGHGLAAATRWLEVLKTYAPFNPHRLVFPTERGCRRAAKGPVRAEYVKLPGGGVKERKLYLLGEWLELAGVKRHLRWHDLRHTCGSSLVRGVWGRKWSLDEVRDMLGHSSVKVTEMYAHLDNHALSAAARATPGPRGADSGQA